MIRMPQYVWFLFLQKFAARNFRLGIRRKSGYFPWPYDRGSIDDKIARKAQA